jgi:hypothetical protein
LLAIVRRRRQRAQIAKTRLRHEFVAFAVAAQMPNLRRFAGAPPQTVQDSLCAWVG